MPRPRRVTASKSSPPTPSNPPANEEAEDLDLEGDAEAEDETEAAESEPIELGLLDPPATRVQRPRITKAWLEGSQTEQSKYIIACAPAGGAWTQCARLAPPVTQALIEDRVQAWCTRRGQTGVCRIQVRRFDSGRMVGGVWGWVFNLAPLATPPPAELAAAAAAGGGSGATEYRLGRIEALLAQQAAPRANGIRELAESFAIMAPAIAAIAPILSGLFKARDGGTGAAQMGPLLDLVSRQSEALGRLRALEETDEGELEPAAAAAPAGGLGALLAPLLGEHGATLAPILEGLLAQHSQKQQPAPAPRAAPVARGSRRFVRRPEPAEV